MRTEDLAPANVSTENEEEDDWDTDVDAINDVSEKEQRWGSRDIVPDRTPFSVAEVRDNVIHTHATVHTGAHHSSQVHKYGEQE